MSPEQADGRPDQMDMRSNVYALGVILYELLTREFPYSVSGPVDEVLSNIRSAEPVRLGKKNRQIDHEVDTIVLKSIDKDKQRRYDTAGALGRDINNYLSGQPIEAKQDSAIYVLRKMLSRHRKTATVLAGILMLCVAATGLLLAMYTRQASLLERVEANLYASSVSYAHFDIEQNRNGEAQKAAEVRSLP